MAEKVKVSREIAEALDTVLPNGNISRCIEAHVKDWDYHPKKPLNNLTTEEFAKCCLVGYEVELTPEEKILDDYLIEKNNSETSPFHESRAISHGYTLGVRSTLNFLGIKIKGINER